MSISADLERFFVEVVWPVRAPFAIALFACIAWWRGCFAVAHA